MEAKKMQLSSSKWHNLSCFSKCLPIPANTSPEVTSLSGGGPSCDEENQKAVEFSPALPGKSYGGWKAMPFVLGNETCERLANIGLLSNFNVFLITVFNLDQVSATNVSNIWGGITNFLPLAGAYLSDAIVGRYVTIAFSSIFALMGMVTMTLIPWLKSLHPPPCPTQKSCVGPTTPQMAFLALTLGFLSIGSAGIRPCSIPFGVDQFDSSTEAGRKGINSFFNWYYTSFTVVLIVCMTVTVYIQTYVSWVIGFGVPTLLMVVAIFLFFMGTKLYVHVKPEGSIFSGIAQALAAAYKKRKLRIPDEDGELVIDGVYYNPAQIKGTVSKKLPLTKKYRFLNKAAMIQEGDLKEDGSRTNKWNLSSIQTIEEIKLILNIVPAWASGIICFLAIGQQSTFTVYQALKMNRRLGPHFEIPAGSLGVVSMVTIGIWLPVYDRVLVPWLRKRTKIEGGITLLQRIGIGLVFSILAMIAAALVEPMRRSSANSDGGATGVAPLSVFWLAPQLVLMGFAEAFNIIGQIELYNKEFPESMLSLANSLFGITAAGANYLSAVLVNVIHHTTASPSHPDWLTKDPNEGRLEYYYYLIAVLGVFNFAYFVYVAPKYKYKSRVMVDEHDDYEKPGSSVELTGAKE